MRRESLVVGALWVGRLMLACAIGAMPLVAGAQTPADREREARALFDGEQYDKAVEALQAILTQDPANRTANILLPFALARAGKSTEALEQVRRSLARLPDNTRLQLLRAGLSAQQEATRAEAIQEYRAILKREPQNLLAQLGLAEALRMQGQTYDAIQAFTQLAERAPSDPRYQIRLGQLYAVLGDLDQARRYFERAYAQNRDNVDAVRSLAILADVEDHPQDAVRYYTELQALYPTDVSVQIALRLSAERLSEPQFPVSIEQMEQTPLDTYTSAVPTTSKQLQHRREQMDATRWRAYSRFLPSFFVAPSTSTTTRQPLAGVSPRDETSALSFSFGWNLGDILLDPYKPTLRGMEADFEAVRASLLSDVSTTYYQRLQNILEYRRLEAALALNPQSAQLRQSKQTTKYAILNLTERLKIITGLP